MSTVKSNQFSPQTQPVVLIDGFNEVESFIVGASQTSFTSTKFDNRTPIRAFKRNDVDPTVWDELTVTFTGTDTFTVAESYSEGDEILMFGIGQYYKGENTVDSDDVQNQSSNTEFTSSTTLTEVIDLLGEASKLESYRNYGIGDINLNSVTITESESKESGLYTLIDTGFAGSLIQFNDAPNIKQVYIPFDNDVIQTRSNEGGSFDDFKPAANVKVVEKTSSFQLDFSDMYTYIRGNSGVQIDVTVPDSATTDFPVGTKFEFIQVTSSGKIAFLDATGVVINSKGLLETDGQYSHVSLVKVATDEWDLYGDVAPSA